MHTPKQLGKLAHANGINAPTLDDAMVRWLENNQERPKAECMVSWWAGWYEGVDEKISRTNPRVGN